VVADDEVFDASVSAVFWSAYQFVIRGGCLSCGVLGDVTYEYMVHEHEVLPVEPSGNGNSYRSAEVRLRDSSDGSPGPGMTSGRSSRIIAAWMVNVNRNET
jgi:hypothetical protein